MKKIIIFILIFITSINISLAQSSLYIEQYPKQTKEDELVYFTLKGEDYSLDTAKIIWKIDGVNADEGVGRITFKYNTPKLNKQKKITAVIERSGLEQLFVELILETTPYIFLYEGKDSLVPPFYKGRALPAKEGQVRLGILSFGDGKTVSWRANGDTLKSDQPLAILNSKLTDNKIKIEADVYDGINLKANLSKNINLKKSEIYLYTKDDVLDIYRPTLGNEKGKEVSIKLDAYYLSAINKKDKNLKTSWSINDIRQDVKDPWIVRFKSNQKENIVAKVEIRQLEKITQRIEKIVNINFE